MRVRLDELWGDRAARELAERVSCRDDDDGRAAEIENAVRRMVAGAWNLDIVALEVAERMGIAGSGSVRELARLTHLSERQLHRRCSAAFGYGPAFLLRINRVQRFTQLARDAVGWPRLAHLAVAAGAIAARVVERIGAARTLVIGQGIAVAALLYLSRTPVHADYWSDLFPAFLSLGVAIGLSGVAIQSPRSSGSTTRCLDWLGA